MNIEAVILAAGKGTRMRSKHPKVIHKVLGVPMIIHVLTALPEKVMKKWVVTGYGEEDVKTVLADWNASFVSQSRQLGTGDALAAALPHTSAPHIMVVPGDMPLLKNSSLEALATLHLAQKWDLTVLTVELENPKGYGRIVREGERVTAIVEDHEATPVIKHLKEVNTGAYIFSRQLLAQALLELQPHPPKGEYYLTDLVSWAVNRGLPVGTSTLSNPEEGMGVNTREQLAAATQVLRRRKNLALMKEGVSLIDPSSIYIETGVKVGPDSTVYPWVYIQGYTEIGEECKIHSHSRLVDSKLGNGVEVLDGCVIEESILEDGVKVGPMAHIRPGTRLEKGVKIGNFVEVKKSSLGEGSKASHLSYIGDATLGRRVNVGAGTITCNYDGFHKHQTYIGDGVFIGSDTQFVAPVKVAQNALIGAGATITKDVPENALALSRAPQKVVPGKGMAYRREKLKREEEE